MKRAAAVPDGGSNAVPAAAQSWSPERSWPAALALAAALAGCPGPGGTAVSDAGDGGEATPDAGTDGGVASAAFDLRVQGNRLVDGQGQPLRLLGVNRDSAEYRCVYQTSGVFAGPVDDAAVALMQSWHVNAVRVPLNEDCWLGINGVNPAVSGASYQAAILDFVDVLRRRGMYAILDLHFNAPGSEVPSAQQVGPDQDHAADFWSSVAAAFKDRRGVIFDLFNEPIHDLGTDAASREAQWACWRDGGCNSLLLFHAGQAQPAAARWPLTGMQQLVTAVRNAGATQPIMLGGLHYANDLTGWAQHLPDDPQHQLIASLHMYDNDPCRDANCWNQQIAPVARLHPVVTGEIGEFDRSSGGGGCPGHSFIDAYMTWADSQGISYLGWAWVVYPQCTPDSFMLIADYATATPTSLGIGLRDHLLRVAP